MEIIMNKNEIIPRGSLERVGECEKCKKISEMYLMEITIKGKKNKFHLCFDCFEKILEIAIAEKS